MQVPSIDTSLQQLEQLYLALGVVLAAAGSDVVAIQDGSEENEEQQEQTASSEVDAAWFKPGHRNRHLTQAGIDHLYGLFEKGVLPYQAAKAMGINPTASYLRHKQWAASKK